MPLNYDGIILKLLIIPMKSRYEREASRERNMKLTIASVAPDPKLGQLTMTITFYSPIASNRTAKEHNGWLFFFVVICRFTNENLHHKNLFSTRFVLFLVAIISYAEHVARALA